MKVVHVLRKPCSESTVAANVLRWGTGALNIDATRVAHANSSDLDAHRKMVEAIKSRGGSMANSWSNSSDLSGANDVSSRGRWPANLVLQHFDGCVQDGVKKVKAMGATGSRYAGTEGPANINTGGAPLARRAWVSEEGTETIAAWACAPGCPVAALDRQSGVLKSGALPHDQYTTGGRDNSSMFAGKGVFTHKGYGADTGGASRFFHQSHTPPYDYFRKLISPDHLPDVVHLHVTAPDTLAKENDAVVHAMTVLAASTDTHWIPHALRALKPGGHLLLAAPDAEPTNDTLVCAAEDAGFEVRDCIFLADSADDRLHYVAKAGKKEREAGLGAGEARKNTHPTVKPVAVMRRLLAGVRRDLPVLDPFVGSGTTLLACVAEGCDGIGVEREGEYFAIATARVDARVSGMLATRTDGEARVEEG